MLLLLTISYFLSVNTWFMYLNDPILGIYNYDCYTFFYRVIPWSLCNALCVSCYSICFKVYFVWYKYSYPFCKEYLFSIPYLSICVYLHLKGVSSREYLVLFLYPFSLWVFLLEYLTIYIKWILIICICCHFVSCLRLFSILFSSFILCCCCSLPLWSEDFIMFGFLHLICVCISTTHFFHCHEIYI